MKPRRKPCTQNWQGTVYIPSSWMPFATDNHNNRDMLYTSQQILLPFTQAKRIVKSPLGTNR